MATIAHWGGVLKRQVSQSNDGNDGLSGHWSAGQIEAACQAACKQAQGLLRSKNEGRRVEAAHLQARALWAMGTQAQREKANKIWAVLRRASSLNTLQERLKITEALQLASNDDSSQADKAIKILEDVVSRSYPGTCTAEAAIVLSELYAQQEYYVKAKRVLDSATKHLQDLQVQKQG